jgi:hypothetical protein
VVPFWSLIVCWHREAMETFLCGLSATFKAFFPLSSQQGS